jgi:hypothetical protein
MAILGRSKQEQEAWCWDEWNRCKNDFLYFLLTYLVIITKKAKKVRFRPNDMQLIAINDLESHEWIYTLKARQLGYSTITAAWFFWKVMFNPHFKAAVLAHTLDSCETIFKIYRTYYDNLPDWMKQIANASPPSKREIMFGHGGLIRVTPHSTMGGTFQLVHASEFAHYDDIPYVLANVFQMVGDGGQIILETTANGLNDAFHMWNNSKKYGDDGQELFLRFFWWGIEKEYRAKPLHQSDFTFEEQVYFDQVLRDTHHEMLPEQMGWVRKMLRSPKIGGNWNVFNQMYPATPEMAFIAAGSKFFCKHYPNNIVPQECPAYLEYEPPSSYGKYLIGVDTASGDPAEERDFHAFVIWRINDNKHLKVVATYKGKINLNEYAALVLATAKRYDAFAVIEINSYGLTVLNHLIEEAYPWLYKRITYDKATGRASESLGFSTNAKTRPKILDNMNMMLGREMLEFADPRLKDEINNFEYNKFQKAEANKDNKDDMVIAAALGLEGLSQSGMYEQTRVFRKRPRTGRERIEWELANGKLYDPSQHFDDDGEYEQDYSSLLNLNPLEAIVQSMKQNTY